LSGGPVIVASLPSFHLSSSISSSRASGLGATTWSVELAPGESLSATLPCLLTHRHRDMHAADASRGVDVPPSLVIVCHGEGGDGGGGDYWSGRRRCWQLVSEAAVVVAPLPDFPMPFHVLTLVSTLLAFLLGSITNTVLRGGSGSFRPVVRHL
jgi:hypothetical protein